MAASIITRLAADDSAVGPPKVVNVVTAADTTSTVECGAGNIRVGGQLTCQITARVGGVDDCALASHHKVAPFCRSGNP